MSVVLIILLLIVVLVLWHSHSDFYGKYIFLFGTVWLVDVVLMSLDVCKVNGIKSNTMSIIVSSTLLYILGFCSLKGKKVSSGNRETLLLMLDKKIEIFARSWLLKLFYMGALIAVLTQFIKVIPLLMMEGQLGGGLRVEALTGLLYSPMFYTFNWYLFSPLYRITLPLTAYLLVTKKDVTTTQLTFLYCLFYPSLFGGRMSFFILGFSVVLCFLWCKSMQVNSVRKDIKRIFVILAVGIVLLFTGMTIAKSGDVSDAKGSFEELKEDIVRQPLRYFVCPLKAFDYAIEQDYPLKLGGYMNGRATFACVDYYVNPVVNKMTGNHNPNSNSKIGYLIQEEWISLSNNVPNWNALYTALLHFYLDFGVIGCFMFSLLFGLITRITINWATQWVSLPLFVLAFFAMTMSFMSFFSYQPVGGDVLPFLFYILVWNLLTKKRYVR